jgi:hypothetical protein
VPGCTSTTVTTTIPLTATVRNTGGNAENGLHVYAFDGTSYTGYNKTTNASGEATFTLPQETKALDQSLSPVYENENSLHWFSCLQV